MNHDLRTHPSLAPLAVRFHPQILLVAIALICVGITGCGGDGGDETSNSNYEVDDPDGGDSGGDTGGGNSTGNGGGSSRPGTASFDEGNRGSDADSVPLSSGPAGRQPPSRSADELDRLTLPENGTPEQLLQHIEECIGAPVQATTPAGVTQEVDERLKSGVAATQLVLVHADSNDAHRMHAAQRKFFLLDLLGQRGNREAAEHMSEFATSLIGNKAEELNTLGSIMTLQLKLADAIQAEKPEADAFIAVAEDIKKLIKELKPTPELFQSMAGATMEVLRAGHIQAGREAVDAIVQAYSNDPVYQPRLKDILERSRYFEFRLDTTLRDFMLGDDTKLEPLRNDTLRFLAQPSPGVETLRRVVVIATGLERRRQFKIAGELFAELERVFASATDESTQKQLAVVLENTKVRMGTIGKPLQLQGVTVDGSLFDLSEYQGKVVHVVFWSTLDNGFLALELPALINLHNAYQSKGFDIVGVNVDTNVEHTDAFFRAQGKDIPWKTIQAGRSEGDLAKQFGVLMFPYSVLVDANGIVVGNYQDSQNLPADLLAMLGPPATPLLNPDGSPIGGPVPGGPVPGSPIGGPVPGGPVPGGPVPGGADTEAIEAPAPQADSTDAADPVPDPPADEEDFEELPELALGNPYLARQGMSAMQLVEFILKLEDRPEGLRERPGFKQAVVDAADRVLAGEAPGKLNGIALEKKLQWLHLISMEDDAADEIAAMVKAARPEQDHPRDEVRHWAELIMLEAEALEVDKLPIEKVEPLLNRLGEYFTGATLESRHLRLASSTIHAVNRIDVEKREEFFQSFGKAFQKSKDKKLASYGKKLIGGSSSDSMAELIGRPINVRGQTGLGTPIDWESYRGQFVLVDFWATWCGPCLRAAPDIRAMYDRNHEQGFDVVGINLDRDPDALSKYLDEENPPWLNVVGEDARTLSEELKIRGIPTLLLIGKDGNVLAASHSVSEIAAALKKVLP